MNTRISQRPRFHVRSPAYIGSCQHAGRRNLVASQLQLALPVFFGPRQRRDELHSPNRKSEMLCWVNERSSNTAEVPLPSGDWVLIPTQVDAG